MIPLRDNIPVRRFPIVTVLLIAANVLVFLMDRLNGQYVTMLQPVAPGLYRRVPSFVGGLSEAWAMIPAHVAHDLGQAWGTVFTSIFMHANWLHIGGNMLYLWIFGNNVEDTLGRFRYLLFYLVCGVGAAMAHVYTSPESVVPTVGASGAVAGLMGAYLILFPRAKILSVVPLVIISTIMEVPAIIVIGFWAVLQFVNVNWLGGGEMLRGGGGVAYMAHLGGFVVGIVLILLLGGRRLVEDRKSLYVEEPFDD